MISGVLLKCSEINQLVCQDLLICEIDIFYKHTVLELAIKADSYDIVCLTPFQQLLTDVWFDKINPHIPNWQVVVYILLRFIFLLSKKLSLLNRLYCLMYSFLAYFYQ